MSSDTSAKSRNRRRVASFLAPWMFVLACLFLVGLAIQVTRQIDMPTLSERAGLRDETEVSSGDGMSLDQGEAGLLETDVEFAIGEPPTVALLSAGAVRLMLVIWPLFLVEAIYLWLSRPWDAKHRSYHFHSLACCLCPPLKLGACWPELSGAMWLPVLGWNLPDHRLRERLVHFFSLPMLGIAILILPVLGTEFFLQEQVHRHPSLRFSLHFGTGLIWFAFATEFIVMISVADRKLAYCKQHWLDLAIILLPIISFLRTLQVLRATRLAKLTKVQQLSKMARIYRLRGVSTRALRALVLIQVVYRLFPTNPEKRLRRMYQDRQRLERELESLDAKIAQLEQARREAE